MVNVDRLYFTDVEIMVLRQATNAYNILSGNSPIQFRNWNWLFKKNWIGIEIDKFWIGIEVSYKTLNPQIKLPFNFLIQKYLFHDNPTWNINYSE